MHENRLICYTFPLQVPYLLLSSVMFVIPYFFIVGFDKGAVADKFFWYWLFQALYMSTLVFIGHLLAAALPNAATAQGTENLAPFLPYF